MLHAVVRAVAVAAAFFCAVAATAAQDYPNKPIKVIAGASAGGTSDIFMRALGDELQKRLGQPVVIENRPGGAFNIGTRACAEAAPDGYTICIIPGEPLVFNQFLFKTLNFDPAALEPITQLFLIDQVLVVGASLNVKSLADLAALSKAKPGTLSYGTFSFQLARFMEKLKQETGADIVKVPFRGGGELVNALLSGSTPVGLLALSNMVPQIQAGLITVIAVNSKMRSPLFPEVPTFAEARSGEQYPSSWFGLFAPVGTPRGITEKLANEIARIVDDREFRQRMYIARAIEPMGMKHEDFARFIREDRKTAERIVKESGHQAE
jgi:tripartite-type tricarboxylate transporter receptor subunit TctC